MVDIFFFIDVFYSSFDSIINNDSDSIMSKESKEFIDVFYSSFDSIINNNSDSIMSKEFIEFLLISKLGIYMLPKQFIENIFTNTELYIKSFFSFENYFIYLNFFNIELFLFFSIIFILVFNVYYSVIRKNPYLVKNSINFFILVLFFCIFITLEQYNFVSFSLCFLFFKNTYIYFLSLVLFMIFIIFLVLLINYYEKNFSFVTYEFVLFIMFSLFSILLSINCLDLLLIYLILEFQSFCFYILTSIRTKSLFSTEAGLKYFILSSLSAGIMLFGISLLYGLTGNIDLYSYNLFDFSVDNYLGIILILIGFIFKFGLVPFHMYMPDVYSGANSFITLFFLIIQKFFLVVLFINLYYNLFVYIPFINLLLIIFVLASILIGSLYALSQFKIKKLIIYSSIVNSGFLLFGFISNNIDGIINSFLFLIIYIITTFLLFIIYLSIKSIHNNQSLISFYDLLMLKKTHVLVALIFTIGLFSIAGIPPLAGFFGKLFLFWSVLKESFISLSIIAIFLTVVTSYYYIKLIKIMFFDKIGRFVLLYNVEKLESYILSVCTIFLVFFFLYPQFIVNYISYILYLYL